MVGGSQGYPSETSTEGPKGGFYDLGRFSLSGGGSTTVTVDEGIDGVRLSNFDGSGNVEIFVDGESIGSGTADLYNVDATYADELRFEVLGSSFPADFDAEIHQITLAPHSHSL